MTRSPFLLRLCQRGAFTVFQTVFFFAVSFCRKRKAVCDHLPHEWHKPSHTAGKPGRIGIRPPKQVSTADTHTSLGVVCPVSCFRLCFSSLRFFFFVWGGSFGVCFLLTRISFWGFFFNMPLLPFTSIFAPFSEDASDGHSRSGCKGNSGIVRKSKVKPPVFGKNLQPCG